MTEKPRTWTLERQWSDAIIVTPFAQNSGLDIHIPTRVIELEPVLNLLELALLDMPSAEHYSEGELRDQIAALLREHGRLS